MYDLFLVKPQFFSIVPAFPSQIVTIHYGLCRTRPIDDADGFSLLYKAARWW